jgi:hypothetical protein
MPPRADNISIPIVAALVLSAAAAALPAAASAGTTAARTPVGRLVLVREHYVHDGTPILHVEERWKKNRLEWLSADGRVRLFLEDDGAELAPRYAVTDARLPGGEVCLGEAPAVAFQSEGSPEKGWRTLQARFDDVLRYCVGWVDEAQRRSYLREFAAAAADFPRGLDLLKQAAVEDFGGWRRRCLEFRVDREYSPSPRVKCLRYSAKAN